MLFFSDFDKNSIFIFMDPALLKQREAFLKRATVTPTVFKKQAPEKRPAEENKEKEKPSKKSKHAAAEITNKTSKENYLSKYNCFKISEIGLPIKLHHLLKCIYLWCRNRPVLFYFIFYIGLRFSFSAPKFDYKTAKASMVASFGVLAKIVDHMKVF